MRLSENFTLAELCVTNEREPNEPGEFEIGQLRNLTTHILQPFRSAVGVPVNVTSAFRSKRVNAAVGGASSSQHVLGQAADIVVAGMSPRQVCERMIALGLPFDQLIQEFGRWVHVSYGPRHRREVLTAVRRANGKVQYLPGLV